MKKGLELLRQKANLIRKWSLISTTEAGSGHPTSCLSAADIAAALFEKYFTYDIKNPLNLTNDRFVLSKGHAAPLLYAAYAMSGALPLEELKTLRKINSHLEGHPTPQFPFTEAATGSLGQGLSVGAGLAYGIASENSEFRIQNSELPKIYVLLGDGELAEGQVWEACNFASHYRLDNLIAIADINRLGQSQETMFGHKVEEYEKRFAAFGFETKVIDGHNFDEITAAFDLATQNKSGKPFAIIAKTLKGKGVSFLENKDGWHGKPVKKEELEKALEELGEVDDSLTFKLRIPQAVISNPALAGGESYIVQDDIPKLGQEIATREVYGSTLARLGETDSSIYALDGDTKNSTFSLDFLKKHPNRFIECFIAEQNMVGVAIGLSRLQKKPFVSTFAAFLTRSADQIRMAGISRANIRFVGSHAGVSIGEDGGSQMGLEDFAMFGAIPDSVIFHPSDAVSCAKLIKVQSTLSGISYLRTLRPKTPVIYGNSEEFVVGGSQILRCAQNDIVTVVAAGITVSEALKAYDLLQKENIFIRVVDCYSIKPIDEETLKKCVKETQKPIVISVEDHYEHGGLGDFVLSALSQTPAKVLKMAVTKPTHSGLKDELLDYEGINAAHIVKRVKAVLKN